MTWRLAQMMNWEVDRDKFFFLFPNLMKTQIPLRSSSLMILTNRCGKFSICITVEFLFAEMKRQKIFFNSDSIITFRLSRRYTHSGFASLGLECPLICLSIFNCSHTATYVCNLISFQSTFCLNLTAQTWKHSTKNVWMKTNCSSLRRENCIRNRMT